MARFFTDFRYTITEEKLRYEYGRLLERMNLGAVFDVDDYANDIALLQALIDLETSKPAYEIDTKKILNLVHEKASLKESAQKLQLNFSRDELAKKRLECIPKDKFVSGMNMAFSLIEEFVPREEMAAFRIRVGQALSELLDNEDEYTEASKTGDIEVYPQ